MRTCEEPRPPNGQSPIALAAGQRSDPEPCSFSLPSCWGVGAAVLFDSPLASLLLGFSAFDVAYKPLSVSLTSARPLVMTWGDLLFAVNMALLRRSWRGCLLLSIPSPSRFTPRPFMLLLSCGSSRATVSTPTGSRVTCASPASQTHRGER